MNIMRMLPRFQAARRAMRELEARESWTRHEISEWQLDRINQLWQRASTRVPYYRGMAKQLNLPNRFSCLEEYAGLVPILSGSELRRRRHEFLADGPCRGAWYRTSGSTGEPLKVFRENVAHREVLAAKYRFYDIWGLDMFDRMIYIWGRWSVAPDHWRAWPGYLQQRLLDRMRKRLRLSAYHLDTVSLRANLNRISDYRPAGIYGFSQAIHSLALEATRGQFECDSLRTVILTSGPVSQRIFNDVGKAFGASVTQEYGSTEFEFIAGQLPDGTLRVREDIVRVETIARENGTQSIVLTPLNNPSFPLLRYEISDASDQPLTMPDRGFAVLSQICGRMDDMLVTKSGIVLYPTRIDNILEFEVGDKVIRQFRVHQMQDGSLTVSLLLFEEAQHRFDSRRLENRLRQLVGGFDVTIETVQRIPMSTSGKHRTITSDRWRERNETEPLVQVDASR